MLEGKLVLECEYDDISKDSRKKESWILNNDGKYGFWDQNDGTYTEFHMVKIIPLRIILENF